VFIYQITAAEFQTAQTISTLGPDKFHNTTSFDEGRDLSRRVEMGQRDDPAAGPFRTIDCAEPWQMYGFGVAPILEV
jgi:hypothetical protein